jgi:hypothetical protein
LDKLFESFAGLFDLNIVFHLSGSLFCHLGCKRVVLDHLISHSPLKVFRNETSQTRTFMKQWPCGDSSDLKKKKKANNLLHLNINVCATQFWF